MYLPIPFTLQSDTIPVLKTRAPYCHHHRSASADSTEYWIWNGPDHHNLEEEEEIQEDAELENTEEAVSSNSELYTPPGVGKSDPNFLSRPEQNASFYDAPSFDKQCSDLSNSLLQDDSGSFDETYSFLSDLPPESFSPPLRQNRRTLDMTYGSSSPSPLRGLGFFDLTRNGDASRPFNGLGAVRLRKRVEEVGQKDENELSSTFLHDLEAYFLLRDFSQLSFDAAIETPMIRVEDSLTPTMEEQPVAPPATPVIPSPTRSSLTSKLKHALRPRGPSTPGPVAMTAIPRSLTTSALSTSIATASSTTISASTSTSSTASVSSTSSFIKRTSSAFRSQYNLNALRAEHDATSKNATSPVKRTRSGVCSPNKSEGHKRTGLSSFLQPVDRASQPVPVIGPTRKVSVSVSMGEGETPATPMLTTPITPREGLMEPMTPMKSGVKRSLQTHFVRDSKDWKDVRDLSVLGTISSGLKKREKK